MNKYKKTRLSFDEKIATSKFDYCKNMKWFIIAPLAIILVGLILFCTIGFNLGMDFTGGSIMTVYANNDGALTQIDNRIESFDINNKDDYNKMQEKISKVLSSHGLNASVYQTTTMEINDLGVSGQGVIVKYKNADGAKTSEIEDLNKEIKADLVKEFGYDFITNGESTVTNGGVITPSASSELIMKSFIALLVALALILIYVAFRFEFTSGLATVLAIFHDLLVTTSLVLMFRITVNSSFIAALVTILGYTINNTIVIFDRIRENTKSGKFDKMPNTVVANTSVKETLTRSIFTTLTTFVTIALVAIIGVQDIRDFAIPIVIGIVSGFYSSVFITPGLWAIAHKPRKKKIKKQDVKPEPKKAA